MKFFSLPCVFFAGCAYAQNTAAQSPIDAESYLKPPKEIASYFDLPRHTQFTLSNLNSTRTWFARVKSRGQVLLSDIANPYENLGGLMLDIRANRARAMSYRTGESIVLTNAASFEEREIKPPAGTWVSAPSWSPDGSTLMFLVHTPTASTIYLHDAAKNQTWQLTSHPLLATRVSPEWVGNSKNVIAVFVPSHRGAEPTNSAVPDQPKVQVTDKEKNRLRTYRSLLQNRGDQDRVEYFMTGQLEVVDIAKGNEKMIGKPAMISSIDSAPNADYFRVTTVQKPFSYLVPTTSFGTKEEVWDGTGKALVMLEENKLRNGEAPPPPPGTTPPAPPVQARRQMTWAPDGNGLIYVRNTPPASVPATPIGGEDADEQGQGRGNRGQAGGGAQGAPRNEELVRWVAPFRNEDVVVIFKSDTGLSGLTFSTDGKSVFFTQNSMGDQEQVMCPLSDPNAKKVLWKWRPAELDKVPGAFVTKPNAMGIQTVDTSSPTLLLRGTQTWQDAEVNPPRPFLDSYEFASGKTTRLWQSREECFEAIDGILSTDGSKLVVDHQSPTEPSNDFLFEGGKQGKQITFNKDLAPDLTNAKRFRFQVTRADGFKFWVKVTLPEWWVQGEKLPALFWFYPSEFETQAAYDRGARVANKNLFPNPGGSPKTLLLRRGWALVEPDCPIVAPRARMNDFYINDLRNNLSAIVDALDVKGYCDRTKLAIGGHSYGGFSTANAMVSTPFFKAGIAGAGNYNRTLTPMAFQSEQRDFFEAPNVYLEMSSLMHAENLSGALLMYAGMEDQNIGTDPTNSIRMFNVLESIGKTAALYMYPYEDHGQIARESLMDQWARWIAWLDKYVLDK